jgi:hypothetical protein
MERERGGDTKRCSLWAICGQIAAMNELNQRYRIQHYIDTFALGHYARVLEAYDQQRRESVAFKVLRPEHLLADGDLRWEYQAFGAEAHLLMLLKDSPSVVKLRDCGYLETIAEAPQGGPFVSFGQDTAAFQRAMSQYAAQGWRPYLALELLPRSDNLLYLMKPNQQGARRRLPSEEGLTLALQFANLLALAHSQRIVYLDHKLEHVYWDGVTLRIIDLNSSRLLQGGPGDAQEYAKDIHNLCVGILYPIFTGMSPLKTQLRPQPGGLDVVEARYSEVQALDFAMEPSLSQALQDWLQRGAQMVYPDLASFRADLEAVCALHGRDFPDYASAPSTRQARDLLREALRHMRQGENDLRQARDLLRDAASHEGLSEDMEDELRRLVVALNDMLNHRVIP